MTTMENGSHYPFVPRTFYGPFENPELSPVKPKHPDSRNEFYVHPENRSKLVRYEYGLFGTKRQMEQDVGTMHELLAGLHEYGLRHVNPEYFDATPEGKRVTPVLGMTVDYVPHTQTLEDLMSTNKRPLNDDEIYTLDKTATMLCAYVTQVEEQGGVVGLDALKLHQFVYTPELEEGERAVLVDVEPIGLVRLQPGEYNSDFAAFMIELVLEIAKVKQKSGKAPLACTVMAEHMIAGITNVAPEVEELRAALRELMRTGGQDRIDNYIVHVMEDSFAEDEDF